MLSYSLHLRRDATCRYRHGDARVHLRILDLDHSVTSQPTLRDAAAWASVETVPLQDLAAPLRLWARNTIMQRARARLSGPAAQARPAITMIGSGDYHHIAVLLIEQAREPITVVHLDNHPDWVRWAPRWHCGSWVNQALKLRQVARIVTLGPCSDDLVRPELKGGNLRALGAGRIVLFPWRHEPSRLFRRIPDGAGHRCENGQLVWRNLADDSTESNVAAILATIETDAIWLTIDKDVLSESEALTNWDQGQMPLHTMLDLICGIAAQRRIVGADICGEFSPPLMNNPLKRIESHIDRPRRSADAAGLRRNATVNCALLQTIFKAAAC
jgi:arginase family enzyme